MMASHLPHDVLMLLMQCAILAAVLLGLFLLAMLCDEAADALSRRRQRRRAMEQQRQAAAEEIARIESEAAASVGRIEAAYWAAREEIRQQVRREA